MRRAAPLMTAALLAAAGATARADEPVRHVSPSGGHVLVLRAGEGGTTVFELARGPHEGGDAAVLAKGTLEGRYEVAVVLDGEAAAILFDETTRGGEAAVRLDAAETGGKVRWRVAVKTLFAGTDFPMRLGRPHWRRATWVDEEGGHVVVVAVGGLVRRIDLATGDAGSGTAELVLEGLALPRARAEALEAVDECAGTLAAAAVPAVAALAGGKDVDGRLRRRAAEVLAKLPSEDVVAAVFKRMKDADAAAAGALLHAAVATGASDLMALMRHREPELLKALDKRTGPLEWLADYFRTHPTSEAVRPLQAALAKNPRHPTLAPKLMGALRTCTGIDLGEDVQAWLRYRHPG